MRTKEGSPAWTAEGSPRSAKTITHRTTHRAFAHHLTLADLACHAFVVLAIAAFIMALCAVSWVVS